MESGGGTGNQENYFLFNCVCGFFIDIVVCFSQRRVIMSMEVAVQKFVDLIVTVRIGRWQLIYRCLTEENCIEALRMH